MDKTIRSFENLDFHTGEPTAVTMETIVVEIDPTEMVDDYAKAFVREASRVNPLLHNQVQLTEDEMIAYARYLLVKRVECVDGTCSDWRRLKLLYIPVFLQYAMRMVGKVVIRNQGLTIVPKIELDDVMSYEDAVKVSEKVGAYEDCLQIVKDAMPRDIEGDESVMSTALIAGYVRARRRVDHVADTYVSAFLGMKLREEQAFAVLYRVQYDDVEFIRTALTNRHEMFR